MFSVILALILILNCMFIAVSCDKDDAPDQTSGEQQEQPQKTPAELFALGGDKAAEYYALSIPGAYEADPDTNKFSLKIEDFVLTGFEQDAEGNPALTVVPDIHLTSSQASDDGAVINAKVAYEEAELAAEIEIQNGSDYYISFPDVTDKFIYFTADDLFETDVEKKNASGVAALFGEMFPAIEEWAKEYIVESNITAEKVNVTVFDTEVTDADKITLTLPKEVFESLAHRLEALGEKYLPEDTEDTSAPESEESGEETPADVETDSISASVSYILKDEELVSCNYAVTVNEQYELKLDCQFKKTASDTGFSLDMNADFFFSDRGDAILSVPFSSHYEETNEEVSGNLEMDLDLEKFIKYVGTPDVTEEDLPEGLPEAELDKMSHFDIAVEYTGTSSDTATELDIECEIGMTDVVLRIPLVYSCVRDGSKVTTKVSVDSQIMNYSVAGNITFVTAAAGELSPKKYDMVSKGISIAEFEDAGEDNERINSFIADFESYVYESEELTELFTYFYYPGFEVGEGMPRFEIYNNYQELSFWDDGTGCYGYYNYNVDIAEDGVITVKDVTGDLVISPKGDGTADISGELFNEVSDDYSDGTKRLFYYSDMYSTEFEIYISPTDGVYFVQYDYFTYMMDSSTLTLDFGTGEESYEYYIDDENDIFYLNGVPYEYYDYSEEDM